MDKPEQRKINVSLDPMTHKRLRFESVEKRQSMSVIIEETLNKHFDLEDESNGRK